MQFGTSFHQSILIALLSCFVVLPAQGQALAQPFADFTMGGVNNEHAQRLSEQLGKPVMLIVLARCNQCEKQLLNLQHLATSYSAQDLVTWVIWTPYKNHQPPTLYLPVLNSTLTANTQWQLTSKTHQLLLINRQGQLVHQRQGSLKSLTQQAQPLLAQWLASSPAHSQGL